MHTKNYKYMRRLLSILCASTLSLSSAFAQDCDPEVTIECPPDAVTVCGEEDPSFTGLPTVDVECFDDDPEVGYEDVIVADDGCTMTIARTWTATADDAVDMCTQFIDVVDDEAPDLIMPDNLYYELEWSVEGANIIDLYLAGEVTAEAIELLAPLYFQDLVAQGFVWPEAFDNCDGEVEPYYVQTLFGSDDLECPLVAQVIWEFFATDECGNTSEGVAIVCDFFDTTPPVFVDTPEDIEVDCIDEVPPPAECVAIDGCSDVVYTDIFVSETGNETDTCTMTTAFGPGNDWAIWIPQLYADGLADSPNFNFVGDGHMDMYNDGTAHVYGVIENDMNSGQQFQVDWWFHSKRNWEEWSDLERSYKDDLGLAAAGGDLWTTWDFYEMADGFSTLTGLEDYEGVHLNLFHSPESYYFGFQCGEAANNKNSNFGFSGWFTYTGLFDGEVVSGNGDINVDKECTPVIQLECPSPDANNEFTYFWSAWDECGNIALTSQTITVWDDVDPTYTYVPEDVTIECDEWPIPMEYPEYMDNCSEWDFLTLVIDTVINDEDPCDWTVTYEFGVIDCNLNRADTSYTVTIVDTTAPMFTFVPEDATYECDEDVPEINAEAEDDCQDVVTVTWEDEIVEGDCPQEYDIIRTFTADDGCGNTATAMQTIHVVDTTPPVFDEYDVQIFADCEELDDVPPLTATDNCDEDVEVTMEEILQSGGCLGVWQQFWTATDDCGNETTVERYITIVDTTPPVIENPDDMTIECDEVDGLPDPEDIPIYDDCGEEVEVTFTETIEDGFCEDQYTIIWHWIAVDVCDNMAEATTTINVQDTTDPEWVEGTLPPSETVECDQPLPEIVYPEATDNCDVEVDVIYTEEILEGECPQEETIQRIWRAFDNCGNQAIYVQEIYIVDTTPPVIDPVEDLVYECDETIGEELPGATDNCSENVEVTFEDGDIIPGDCPQEYSFERCYSATDECDNTSTVCITITVEDTTPPELTVGEDMTLECDEEVPSPVYTATDNCDLDVIVDVSPQITEGECPQEYVMVRTYTATDDCGNMTTMTQTITVVDTTPPTLTVGEDMIIECDQPLPDPEWTAEDNCDDEVDVTVTPVTTPGDCPQEYTMVRTYVAVDDCGNETTMTQTLTIVDTTDPIIVAADDLILECDEEVPAPSWEVSDNCDTAVQVDVSPEIIDGDCPQEYVMIRTYTATDACGNTSTDTQTITVQDTTPPVLYGVPEDTSINCDEPIPNAIVAAEDNCDDELVVSVEAVTTELPCGSLFTRTWCTTDDCGNETCETQVITLVDDVAPVFTYVPADFDIECDYDSIPYEDPIAEDNCSEFVIDFEETIEEGECPQDYYIIRCWTATDDCDNVSEACQTIHVMDTTPPVFDEFDIDVEMPCDEIDDSILVTATDNCGNVTITYEDTWVSGGCIGTLIRDYTATDECGNEAMAQQIIMLTDDEAPEVVSAPEDTTYECDEEIIWDAPVFEDNCDDELDVEYSMEEEDDGCSVIIMETWTATDDCDNSTTVTRMILVEDSTEPWFDCENSEMTVECDTVIDEPVCNAYDNCDEDLDVDMEMTTEDGDCPNEWTDTYTWTATDDCGNTASVTVVVNYVDTTPPVFDSVPQSQEVSCDETYNIGMASATDNCGDVTITPMESIIPGECPQAYTVVVTWTAEDECGNTSTAESFIYIYDNTPPEIADIIADINVQCPEDVPDYDDWVAFDNCDPDPEIQTITDVLEEDECGNYVAEVTCIATDACGNSSEQSFMITVQDDTPPVLLDAPEDLVLDCDAEVPAAPELEGEDNCGAEVEVSFDEEWFGDLPEEGSVADCDVINPSNDYYDYNWGLLMQEIPNGDYHYEWVSGEFVEYEDGTAHLTGQVESFDNPGNGWEVDVWFENGLNWDDWSNQEFPTSYKDDLGFGIITHVDWWYYLLNGDAATLTGTGGYAGSVLTLTHAPSSYYYGFQVGVGASNVNGEYGAGGWFYYEGTMVIDGVAEEVTGTGDFAFDLDCCPDYWIERTWCATDCSGNEVCHTQTITFDELGDDIVSPSPGFAPVDDTDQDMQITRLQPNPAMDVLRVEVVTKYDKIVSLEIVDLQGSTVQRLYNGHIEGLHRYTFDVSVDDLQSGLYFVRMATANDYVVEKLLITQ